MERYTMFLDWKNQYCEKDSTTQSNVQIQCTPYQNTHDIFHRTRTNNPKRNIEPQNTLIALFYQDCFSKDGDIMLPDYKATIITKTDVEINGIG